MKQKPITRRKFLKDTSYAVAAGSLYFRMPALADDDKSKVVLIRDEALLDAQGNLNAALLRQMLDEAVTALTNQKKVQDAWKTIIKPSDTVGIKTNAWRNLPTPQSLEVAIRNRIMECDVRKEKISIDDRGILNNPVFQKATALINVRPMRTHDWAGVGTLIKNYIMFVDKPWEYHPDSCADLAAIWKLPHVVGKTRLNILVMITPQFHHTGAHHYNPEYTWPYQGLLVGFDPVAVDSMGKKIITSKRKEYFKEDRPINPPPKHIILADTRHQLGHADPEKIELIRLGWMDNALI